MTEESDLQRINALFQVYEVRTTGTVIKYYGEPKVNSKTLLTHLWNDFAQRGYDIVLRREHGEYVLLAIPVGYAGEKKHVNAILAIATVFATMFTGAVLFYGVNPLAQPLLLQGLPLRGCGRVSSRLARARSLLSGKAARNECKLTVLHTTTVFFRRSEVLAHSYSSRELFQIESHFLMWR